MDNAIQVQPVFNVLIIGAGQIGAFFDQPGSTNILTHAHAFSRHSGFHLLGFVDNNMESARKAADIWGGKAFKDLETALGSTSPDIISLAVPDEYHYGYLHRLSSSRTRLIFAEKPLCQKLYEADEIKNLYNNSSIEIAVNYSRCFVPGFVDLKKRIAGGEFGNYLTGSGYYGKGFVHNGSHMVNLLEYLLGRIVGSQVMVRQNDFYDEDASLSVVLELEGKGKFYMQNVDCRAYTIFELELFFSDKRVRILDGGFAIEEYSVVDSSTFSGYRNIGAPNHYSTGLGRAIEYAADNIYDHLRQGRPLNCTLEDGYRAIYLCNEIRGRNTE